MKRRQLLGTFAGGLAALGGCIAGERRDPATAPGDDGGKPTAETPTGDGGVTIRSVAVAPGIVTMNSPDSIGTYGDRAEQFVIVIVDVEDSPAPERDAFVFEAGGETYSPTERPGNYGGRLWGYGEPYDWETGGWITFTVPKPLAAVDAAINWSDSEHTLREDVVERLQRPSTDFEIREFEAPDSVQFSEEAVVTLTVENVGGADGTFVGALNRIGPWVAYTPEEAISLDVGGGQSETWRHVHTPDNRHRDHDEKLTMKFDLNVRGDSIYRSVDVEAQ